MTSTVNKTKLTKHQLKLLLKHYNTTDKTEEDLEVLLQITYRMGRNSDVMHTCTKEEKSKSKEEKSKSKQLEGANNA